MKDSKIQIRVSESLKTRFESAVAEKGLDTSTAIRIMMNEFSIGKINIGVTSEFDKGIEQAKKDYENGNYIVANTDSEIDNILDAVIDKQI
jgi:antitoxin component of RelBE/YafQ-DinJ toxin-antitoxin module